MCSEAPTGLLWHCPSDLTATSRSQHDIDQTYDLGVNAFLSKPNSIDDLMQAIQILHDFWFRTVRLPS